MHPSNCNDTAFGYLVALARRVTRSEATKCYPGAQLASNQGETFLAGELGGLGEGRDVDRVSQFWVFPDLKKVVLHP